MVHTTSTAYLELVAGHPMCDSAKEGLLLPLYVVAHKIGDALVEHAAVLHRGVVPPMVGVDALQMALHVGNALESGLRDLHSGGGRQV